MVLVDLSTYFLVVSMCFFVGFIVVVARFCLVALGYLLQLLLDGFSYPSGLVINVNSWTTNDDSEMEQFPKEPRGYTSLLQDVFRMQAASTLPKVLSKLTRNTFKHRFFTLLSPLKQSLYSLVFFLKLLSLPLPSVQHPHLWENGCRNKRPGTKGPCWFVYFKQLGVWVVNFPPAPF